MKDNIVGYLLSEEVSDAVEFKIKSEDKSGFVLAEGVLQNGNAVNRKTNAAFQGSGCDEDKEFLKTPNIFP